VATIVKRGPRQWQAKVRRRGYRQLSKTFSTKARAERWATMVESKMEQRTFVDSSASESTTFDELCARYDSGILRKQKSIHEAPFRLRRLRAEFGVYRLAAILPPIVARYRDSRLSICRRSEFETTDAMRRVSPASERHCNLAEQTATRSARGCRYFRMTSVDQRFNPRLLTTSIGT